LFWLGFGIAGPLLTFAGLGEEVAEREPLRFDAPIQTWLHAHATPGLDRAMLTITNIGGARGLTAIIVALVLLFLILKRWRDALFIVLAVGGAELTNLALKALFGRPRPSLWDPIVPETSFSFPSGHATGAFAFGLALAVVLWHTRWRVWALIGGALFGVLVAVSRVYLGVHYPSDVLAGAAASTAWVTVLALVLRREIFAKPEAATTTSVASESSPKSDRAT
jgi:undecaprenyl-diphosphatase